MRDTGIGWDDVVSYLICCFPRSWYQFVSAFYMVLDCLDDLNVVSSYDIVVDDSGVSMIEKRIILIVLCVTMVV